MNVCVKCRCEMRVKTNGFYVEEMADTDRPYRLWFTDLWYCPSCGIEVVAGFAREPDHEHYMPAYWAKSQTADLRYWPRPDMVPAEAVEK